MVYEYKAVGRRLTIQWSGDRGKPWYKGVVKAYFPFAKPPQHQILYDDGDLKEHCLVQEEAYGQLKWLDDAASGGGKRRKKQPAPPPPRAATTAKASTAKATTAKAPAPPQGPAPEPPYDAEVVGRRVSLQWVAELRKPWYNGRVAEFRHFSVPPTHLVVYDDGDQREHVLDDELAEGQLKWLDANGASLAFAPALSAAAASASGAAGRGKKPKRANVRVVGFGDVGYGGASSRADAADGGEWTAIGHPLVGTRARRLVYLSGTDGQGNKRAALSYVDGTITKWWPPGADPVEDPALFYFEHDADAADGDGGVAAGEAEAAAEPSAELAAEEEVVGPDGEDLEDDEAAEAVAAYSKRLYEVTYPTPSRALPSYPPTLRPADPLIAATQVTYHDLIKEYVAAGVRLLGADGKTVTIEREALPDGLSADEYFDTRDLYVGNFCTRMGHRSHPTPLSLSLTAHGMPSIPMLFADGHVDGQGTIMDLARAHAPHKTTCCREPMVAVVERDARSAAAPRPLVRMKKTNSLRWARKDGWPHHHPSQAMIRAMGVAEGGFVCTRAVCLAALRWPKWYEFIEATEEADGDLPNYERVMKQNQGVVTHMVGEAVMPALAQAIMGSAAAAAAAAAAPADSDSNADADAASSSTPTTEQTGSHAAAGSITTLVDLFCCGGGFSLGAAAALPGLQTVDGFDNDRIVLRNYQHNLSKALPEAAVTAHERDAPASFAALAQLLPSRTLGRGAHCHLSPPCQVCRRALKGFFKRWASCLSPCPRIDQRSRPLWRQSFVNASKDKKTKTVRDVLPPYFQLLIDACAAGCTVSLEEHSHVSKVCTDWLAQQEEATRRLLYVYKVSARDYGSPTNRDRCIITSFPLAYQTDINPAHAT